MKKDNIPLKIALFFLFFLVLLSTNQIVKNILIDKEITNYNIHLLIGIGSNIILSLVSLYFIKKNELLQLSGLHTFKAEKAHLLLFPLVFLVGINLVFGGDISEFTPLQLIVLAIYCLSIGFSEEFSIRGVLFPLLIKHGGGTKKSITRAIFISSLIFGLLHLIKFDKGLYGEISQVFFATFIGVLFGALLIATKSIYPLIIIHALIDFAAKIDSIGIPFEKTLASETDITGAIFLIILTLPCLLFGMYIIKKHIPEKIQLNEYQA
ncbi:CPBP family intramembrane glutamic endopeptidase [Tenacibaculum sp. 190524A05c]|uniref:CPBP family intramembrane glutamic endopeptidase n=1 Tax=Tenacibaculum platacis TaxID=3137852 RepID=UPI0031FABF73